MREHLDDPPRLEDVVRIVSRRLRAADLISRTAGRRMGS